MDRIKFVSARNAVLGDKARRLIPGGSHTYSKGADQFPANAPQIIDRGLGAYIWDVDQNKYLDLGMSLGTVILGHAYEPVLEAVRKEIVRGVNFVRPSVREGELAEMLNDIIPSAEMVKFGKNGSDAVTAAVKLARAYTGRKYVARCTADPFNAIHDWFIGSTVMNSGVPVELQNLTLKYDYNDIASVERLFARHPREIAAILLEPVSLDEPKDGFLENLKALCEKNGALLIFDEVVSGFRFDLGGAQKMIGVTPHLSAFGKAMANGFCISALCGQREFMRLGGLDHDRERVFLLSTTHGGETHAIAAAIATINEIKKHDLIKHFYWVGNSLMTGVRKVAREIGAENYVDVLGYGCKPAFVFKDGTGAVSMKVRTIFLQETVARGVLMPYVVPSFSHQQQQIEYAIEAIGDALSVIKEAVESDRIDAVLQGEAVKPVFRKFN